MGSIQVDSFPSEAEVILEGKEVGKTPLTLSNLMPGIYSLELKSTQNSVDDWQGKVEVAPGKQSFFLRNLGPKPYFSSGSFLMYSSKEKGTEGGLTVTSSPSEARVWLKGKLLGTTPLVLDSFEEGVCQLEVEKDGYLYFSFDLTQELDYWTQISVDLALDPLSKLELVDAEKIPLSEESLEPNEIKLWNKEVSELDVLSKYSLYPWERLKVFHVETELEIGPEQWYQGLLFWVKHNFSLPAPPFAYLVTADGEIYEGLGVRDFDFSSFSTLLAKAKKSILDYEPGDCVVFYLGENKGDKELGDVLARLQNFIRTSPSFLAEMVASPENLRLEAGKSHLLTLTYRNQGQGVWFGKEPTRIMSVSLPLGERSEFYSSRWLADDKIVAHEGKPVLPRETVNLSLDLEVPWRLGEHKLRVALWDEETKQIISGSEAEILLEVFTSLSDKIRVLGTSTGFLSVRSKPDLTGAILGQIYPEEKYIVLERSTDWVKIRLNNGIEGWISSRYTEKD